MSSSAPPASPSPATHSADRLRLAWFVLAVLLLFSIAAPLNQFKVPPILPIVMQFFNISVGQAGLLMSVYAITGVVLALPAGLIFQRAGFRLTSLLAGGSIVIGVVWGALSHDMPGLLASRVVEGIGTSFIAVLAPAVIALWFAANKRGIAMGIWSNWVPLGSVIMLFLAPLLAQSGNWRVVWWFGALYALVVTGLFLVFVKRPPAAPAAAAQPALVGPAVGSTGRVLRNTNLWLISLTFALFNMAYMGFTTFLPTYLSTVRNIPLAHAAQVASLGAICAMIAAPLAGIWSDRIGSRKVPYLLGLALGAMVIPVTSFFTGNVLIGLICLQGLIAGLVPPNIFSAAVEVVEDERWGGLAMGVVMVGQNAGTLVGPLVFGALVESAGGWPVAFGSAAVFCLGAIIAGGAAKLKNIRQPRPD
jgi:MFS family permease